MDSESSVNGFGISYGLPTVVAPVNNCRHEHFDSEISSIWDCANLLVEPPCSKFRTGPLSLISDSGLRWHVEDLPFTDRSCEFDIFRVRPHKGHSRPRRAAVVKPMLGDIFRVPDLFWNQASGAGLSLDHM